MAVHLLSLKEAILCRWYLGTESLSAQEMITRRLRLPFGTCAGIFVQKAATGGLLRIHAIPLTCEETPGLAALGTIHHLHQVAEVLGFRTVHLPGQQQGRVEAVQAPRPAWPMAEAWLPA